MHHTLRWFGVIMLLFYVLPAEAIQGDNIFYLPPPSLTGEMTLEEALFQRRSTREFTSESVTLEQLAQLLWACQGITAESQGVKGKVLLRTVPSPGGLYPLRIYAVVSRVVGLEPGIYYYDPGPDINTHRLALVKAEDAPNETLAHAALKQPAVSEAAVNILIFGEIDRLEVIYGERAERFLWLETGHAAQNICLQATALGLGSIGVGSFYDDLVKQFIGTSSLPLFNISIGQKVYSPEPEEK